MVYCIASLFNPLNAKLNPICHLLALIGAHHIFYVSELRVKAFTVVLEVAGISIVIIATILRRFLWQKGHQI